MSYLQNVKAELYAQGYVHQHQETFGPSTLEDIRETITLNTRTA